MGLFSVVSIVTNLNFVLFVLLFLWYRGAGKGKLKSEREYILCYRQKQLPIYPLTNLCWVLKNCYHIQSLLGPARCCGCPTQ
jgi:hypothetical protein